MAKDEWVSVTEAALILNIKERTVYRRIKKGELLSKKQGRTTLVAVDSSQYASVYGGGASDKMSEIMAELKYSKEYIEHLKSELDYFKSMIAGLLNSNQRLIEAQTERVRHRPWWKFWGDD